MKRFTAFLLIIAMLLCVAVFSFADSSAQYRLVLSAEGRFLEDLSGNKVNGDVSAGAFERLYTLVGEGNIDLNGIVCSEIEVMLDEYSSVSLGRQTVTAKDGSVYVSSNAEAVIFTKLNRFVGCGAGESLLSVCDGAGNEISSSLASVTAMTSGKNLVVCLCPKCGDNQLDRLHAMSCGHFSCEEGEVDHGPAPCGCVGHFKCDGKDHGICPNCLERLCEGEHGENVCKHTHTVKRSNLFYSKSKDAMFQVVYCPICGIYYVDQVA